MESPSGHRKEPRVPGPNVERRIPPPSTGRAAIPRDGSRHGVSVPVYPKLPDRPISMHVTTNNRTSLGALFFDASLALVSVAFCILYYSEL
ncbi:MAG: hypothetical protein O3C43_19715 [Verrucomicrobia bacterium]|nr:hypothetical protein [Verrucomicrobiota bacterium]MDA1068720.1 hypothetical protein [Verrucomicrobiota bacterium]